jgi:hypothetical protein
MIDLKYYEHFSNFKIVRTSCKPKGVE